MSLRLDILGWVQKHTILRRGTVPRDGATLIRDHEGWKYKEDLVSDNEAMEELLELVQFVYPNNERVEEFLKSFVADPVIDALKEQAAKTQRPMRKILGHWIEDYWAIQLSEQWRTGIRDG